VALGLTVKNSQQNPPVTAVCPPGERPAERRADSLDGSVASAFEMVTRPHEFTKTFQSRKMKVAGDVYL
jgi:hypothetical protein